MKACLSLLLDRLLWPSCLVKERACRELADLLNQPSPPDGFSGALEKWTAEQTLETTCAYGLLVLLRAKLEGKHFHTEDLGALGRRLKSPSLLAALLLRELGAPVELAAYTAHSEDAPHGVSAPDFFIDHVESFLPPIYLQWAENLEDATRLPFIRQWAFEWQQLMQREGLKPTTRPGEYWGAPRSRKRFAPAETRIAEVYRSAFLRSLAWALQSGGLDEHNALVFAAKTCPVDLALWLIPVGQLPSWWPFVSSEHEVIDATPVKAWTQVEVLWKKQDSSVAWTDSDALGGGRILLAASGPVSVSPRSCELQVLGAFQRCLGSNTPNLKEVFEVVRQGGAGHHRAIRKNWDSKLASTGTLTGASLESSKVCLDDWELFPANAYLRPPTTPRWQAWRMNHALRVPLPPLNGGELAISLQDGRLVFTGKRDGAAIWQDWHLGIHEERDANLPEPSGYWLTAPRSWIEETANRLGARFVWICQLKAYHPHEWQDQVQVAADYRVLGSSSIVLPE